MTGIRRFYRFSRLVRSFAPLPCILCLFACSLKAMNAQTIVDIHAIQTDLPASPYLGQSVTTTGIVIAVLSDGFYIENLNSDFDSDVCTSEGIYVYTPSITPSSYVALQESVTVTGVVEASNGSSYAGTQIYIASPNSSSLVVNSTGNTLPSAVASSTLTTATSGTCSLYAAGTFGQWLPFEGMRVNVPSSSSLLVTQGTGGAVNAASQTATTNGAFWAVFTTTRPFRANGIDILDPAAALAPSTVTEWSANPQLLLVDSTSLGGTALNASAGTEYTGSAELVGIIDYHVSTQGYTGLLLTSASVAALSAQSGATPTAAPSRLSNDQITFATLDLNSLVSSETNRLTKLSNAIVNYMKSPDVIAMQGADAASLNSLPGYITSAGGPSYTLTTELSADSSGLYNAFLVNTRKFDGTPTATTALCSSAYDVTLPVSGTTEALFDRCPLVLTVNIPRTGISDFTVYIVNANLMERSGLSATSTSEDTRYRREQQAQLLATQVLEPLENAGDHVMVLGGLNSFEFSDGYVDTVGIIDGAETSSNIVWLYDSTYNSSTLVNSTTSATNLSLAKTNPSTSRYTYVENGSAEQPDHILYTTDISSLVSIDYARIGADFPVSAMYDTSTVARATNHDAIVAYFTTPYDTMTTITSNTPNPSVYDESVTFTVQVCVVASSTSTTCVSGTGTPDGTVTFIDSTTGTTMGTATLSGGTATFSYSALTVGTHTITASYGGSESNLGYQPSSGTTQQVVEKDTASVTLGSSPNPSYYGDPVTLTATASSSGATPTGTVTFTDTTTATTLGTATLASGVATLSVSTLSVGTHVLQATYSGDTTDTSATSNTVSQVVLPVYATTSTLTCSPNPAEVGTAVTCADTVSSSNGTPTGTVTFYDGTTELGTATLTSGVATFSTSSLTVGTHAITADYPRTDPYLASISNAVDEIIASTFSLTAKPASFNIYTGEKAVSTITVTPGTDFTLDVALTCLGLPANTTCSLSPTTVTGGSGTSILTIQSTAPSQTESASNRRAWPTLAGLLLLLVPKRLRRWRALTGMLVLLAGVALTFLNGCGGSGSLSGGTPTGSYPITVTGTAQIGTLTITETTTVTVNVKSLF